MQEDSNVVMENNGVAADQVEANIEDLGLEVVEDIPQISLARPVRHIRRR
ncbi:MULTISPECIES: hypothetical protein [Photorhabdus]|nr:hypothetical protein [Photorhabdus thracensis]